MDQSYYGDSCIPDEGKILNDNIYDQWIEYLSDRIRYVRWTYSKAEKR